MSQIYTLSVLLVEFVGEFAFSMPIQQKLVSVFAGWECIYEYITFLCSGQKISKIGKISPEVGIIFNDIGEIRIVTLLESSPVLCGDNAKFCSTNNNSKPLFSKN